MKHSTQSAVFVNCLMSLLELSEVKQLLHNHNKSTIKKKKKKRERSACTAKGNECCCKTISSILTLTPISRSQNNLLKWSSWEAKSEATEREEESGTDDFFFFFGGGRGWQEILPKRRYLLGIIAIKSCHLIDSSSDGRVVLIITRFICWLIC